MILTSVPQMPTRLNFDHYIIRILDVGDASLLQYKFSDFLENERLHFFHVVLLLLFNLYAHVCINVKNFCVERSEWISLGQTAHAMDYL